MRKLFERWVARSAYHALMRYGDVCLSDTTSDEYRAVVTVLDYLRKRL